MLELRRSRCGPPAWRRSLGLRRQNARRDGPRPGMELRLRGRDRRDRSRCNRTWHGHQAIASDESVFVVGASHATSDRGPSVSELNNDGSPAVGFGAGGTTFVGHGLGQEGGFEALTGAGIRPSFGQLLVAGSYGASFSRDHWAVARLKADGSLDESFGIGGIAEVETVGGYSTSLAPASVGAWRWIGRSLWADRVPPPPALLGSSSSTVLVWLIPVSEAGKE